MILAIETIQKTIREYFAGKPVNRVWLFGSYARNEAHEDSDVDVLIDLDKNAGVGLEYYIWRNELAKLLDKKVDFVSAGWENTYVKPFIDKDKSIIYEK